MDRRAFLKTGLTAASSLVAAPLIARGLVSAAQAADQITFYSLASVSGSFASTGKFMDMGSKLAVKEFGRLLDAPVGLETIDTEGSPAKAVRKVQEAIQARGAKFFEGVTLSSEALGVSKEVAKAKGVFFTSVGADEITGSNCNRSTFNWAVPAYGAVKETVGPLIDMLPKAKRWYTITPQYVFGEAMLASAIDVFKEKGVEHVGGSSHSLGEQEFSGYLTNAMAAKPDVLLLLNFGGQSSACLRQAVSFGIKQQMAILLVWSAGLDQFQELGPDILSDVYVGAQYWHQIDTPMNVELVKRVRAEYGITCPYVLTAGYIGTWLILDAIRRAGVADPTKVFQALEGYQYQGPTGAETIRAEDHQVIKDYYLLKGKNKSAMKDADDFFNVVSSGKSFPAVGHLACKMD